MERSKDMGWIDVKHPGYLGKDRDNFTRLWNKEYGLGNWRLINKASNGEKYKYEDIIYKIYIPGYMTYFLEYPAEAEFIASNYSYGYDKDKISKVEAFNIYALYNKVGKVNQFHHVAFNLALINLGYRFKGKDPTQVREGKPGTPKSAQPNGYLWSPGRIPCTIPELIPQPATPGWWNKNSIEDFYQSTKMLQVRI